MAVEEPKEKIQLRTASIRMPDFGVKKSVKMPELFEPSIEWIDQIIDNLSEFAGTKDVRCQVDKFSSGEYRLRLHIADSLHILDYGDYIVQTKKGTFLVVDDSYYKQIFRKFEK